ncbi:MAG: alginate lyase family protein [Planctomycetota bacterium]
MSKTTPCLFDLESLEERRLLTTPDGVRPDNVEWLDRSMRADLVARLDNFGDQALLESKLPSGSSRAFGAFDELLFNHIKDRTNVAWYFDDEDAAALGDYLRVNLDESKPIGYSDSMVDDRRFPADNSSNSFIVELAGDIDWSNPENNGTLAGAGSEFVNTLNRFEYWYHLTDALQAAPSGEAKYAEEMLYHLADWSGEHRTDVDSTDNFLDLSLRTQSWTWGYFHLLGSPHMTQQANTLFLYKLIQHGDALNRYANELRASNSIANNRVLSLGRALHGLGVMLPELDNAAAWEQTGRQLLIDSMNAQVYPDGGHIEQSPGYQLVIANELIESYLLDQRNGKADAWGDAVDTIDNAVEAYRQLVSPNGERPGIGDTYRIPSYTLFLKAGTALGKINAFETTFNGSVNTATVSFPVTNAAGFEVGDFLATTKQREVMRVTDVSGNVVTVERGVSDTTPNTYLPGETLYNLGSEPFAKPRTRDVWLLGEEKTRPFMKVPPNPPGALGARGNTFALTDAGYFVLRSDDGADATQITFDAGPKGGFHGHYDPLGIEVFSGGRPLVIDPGPYQYDDSAERDYVISTRAHNTLNVDGQNVAVMEDPDGTGPQRHPGITFSHDFARDYAQVTASHDGYASLAGSPKVTRSIWYDYGGNLLVADFVAASAVHDYEVSFSLPDEAAAETTGTSLGYAKTRYADAGRNVAITPITSTDFGFENTFVTDINASGLTTPAKRFTFSRDAKTAIFLTHVELYDGRTTPDATVTIDTPQLEADQPFAVTLTTGGKTHSITFDPAGVTPTDAGFGFDGTFNDIAADASGNLHAVWLDRTTTHLNHSVRNVATGTWSTATIVDDSAPFVGQYPDLAIDNAGRPAVAYFDGNAGDLKYAILDAGVWQTRTVDSTGSVGQYPSLIFSRDTNVPIIAYYDRTSGSLNIADAQGASGDDAITAGWKIDVFIDGVHGGTDVGRFPELRNDPNEPGRDYGFVVGFENTSNGQYEYAHRLDGSWVVETISDPEMSIAGGYLSIGFDVVGSRWEPRVSYYESSPDTSLKFAERDNAGVWSVVRLDGVGSGRSAGIYSELRVDGGVTSIFYRDAKDDRLVRATREAGQSGWAYDFIDNGGREIHTARAGDRIYITNLDETNGRLSVLIR